MSSETIIEYGVNELVGAGGVGHNPFDSNFDSPDAAEAAARELMKDYPDVTQTVIFQLTIVDNTIVNDETLLTLSRNDLGLSEGQTEAVGA